MTKEEIALAICQSTRDIGWRCAKSCICRREENKQWISVKDRLPEIDKWVLVSSQDWEYPRETNIAKISKKWADKEYWAPKDFCCDDFTHRLHGVTHWIELPEFKNEVD